MRKRVSLEKVKNQLQLRKQYSNSPPKYVKIYQTQPKKTYSKNDQVHIHYNNAVYMGGSEGNQRHGVGILLHDDGSCAITSYKNNQLEGHTVIFRENSIVSLLLNKDRYEIAYKQGKSLIVIPFDNKHQAQGQGLLLNYQAPFVHQLRFQDGKLTEKKAKIVSQLTVSQNQIITLIAPQHQRAFSLDLVCPKGAQVSYDDQQIQVGFIFDGKFDGIGFKLYAQNIGKFLEKSLYLKFIERGSYSNGKLNGFGQRRFAKNSIYIGHFERGQFCGKGLLVLQQQKEWVLGDFKQRKLVNQIKNSKQNRDFYSWSKQLKQFHQMQKQIWVDQSIQLPNESFLHSLMQKSLSDQTNIIQKQKFSQKNPKIQRNQVRSNLADIQKHFENGSPSDFVIEDVLSDVYANKTSKTQIDIPKQQKMNYKSQSRDYKYYQKPTFQTAQQQYLQTSELPSTYSQILFKHLKNRTAQGAYRKVHLPVHSESQENHQFISRMANRLKVSPGKLAHSISPSSQRSQSKSPDKHNRKVHRRQFKYLQGDLQRQHVHKQDISKVKSYTTKICAKEIPKKEIVSYSTYQYIPKIVTHNLSRQKRVQTKQKDQFQFKSNRKPTFLKNNYIAKT